MSRESISRDFKTKVKFGLYYKTYHCMDRLMERGINKNYFLEGVRFGYISKIDNSVFYFIGLSKSGKKIFKLIISYTKECKYNIITAYKIKDESILERKDVCLQQLTGIYSVEDYLAMTNC